MIEKLTAKMIAYVVIALVLIGSVTAANSYRKKAARAEADRARIAAQFVALQANSEFSMKLVAANAERERQRATAIEILATEVRDAERPIPKECEKAVVDALRPTQRALDGVRSLRAERDGAPAAKPVVQPRPRATASGDPSGYGGVHPEPVGGRGVLS